MAQKLFWYNMESRHGTLYTLCTWYLFCSSFPTCRRWGLPCAQHLHDITCFPSPCSKHRAFRPHQTHPRTVRATPLHGVPSVLVLSRGRQHSEETPVLVVGVLDWSVTSQHHRWGRRQTFPTHFGPPCKCCCWTSEVLGWVSDEVGSSHFLTVQNPRTCPPWSEVSGLRWVCCVHVDRRD